MEEKEFKAKLVDDRLIFSEDVLELLKKSGFETFKVKIAPDIEEICKREKISKKIIEKIANTQRIPVEIALGVIRAKGKILK